MATADRQRCRCVAWLRLPSVPPVFFFQPAEHVPYSKAAVEGAFNMPRPSNYYTASKCSYVALITDLQTLIINHKVRI